MTDVSHETWIGDCRDLVSTIPPDSVQCVVTSPPYWPALDYDVPRFDEAVGQEETSAEYIHSISEVFARLYPALKDDGVVFLVLGHSDTRNSVPGVPWRVALQLMHRDWYLQRDIVWNKVGHRVEKRGLYCSHDYIFMLSKSRACSVNDGGLFPMPDVWTIEPETPRNDYWTMPAKLAARCIEVGSRPGEMVLDAFAGSGTVGHEAKRLGRSFIGIELDETQLREAS